MKLETLFLTGVLLLGSARACFGQETANAPHEPNVIAPPTIKAVSYGFDLLDIGRELEDKLSFQLSATFQSQHIWHGFDLMDSHGVFFPVATMTLGDTGFSAKIIGAYALGGGLDECDELNYALFYSRDFLQDACYATHCTLNYFYYGKPKRPSHLADAQEIGLGLSWPQLLGNSSLVPNYYFGSIWPSKSNSLVSGISGFIHVFGLAYNLPVHNLRPDGRPQPFRFYGDITYNDGFCGVDRDWSHVALGVSTNLEIACVSITPSLNYQISMDDSVNTENELWGGVSFTYSF